MNLLGVDVGFGAGKTTGMASLSGDRLRVGRAGKTLGDRLPWTSGSEWMVLAVDAPLVPPGTAAEHVRTCERALITAGFQKRCKPGMSHIRGTGQKLRAAGGETAAQLESNVRTDVLPANFPRVRPPANIVEAFPNAYLGVALDDDCYSRMPSLRRKKFDWLFDQWCAGDLFRAVAREVGLPDTVSEECQRNRDHEERAALVCLVTAASVMAGNFVAVGDSVGGYLFLPPWARWAKWAKTCIDSNRQLYPECEVWISGAVFTHRDRLPSGA